MQFELLELVGAPIDNIYLSAGAVMMILLLVLKVDQLVVIIIWTCNTSESEVFAKLNQIPANTVEMVEHVVEVKYFVADKVFVKLRMHKR